MNSRHANIKFTVEEEENDYISFLNIAITGIDGKLSTSIHRKKTYTGVYVTYNSFVLRDYKRGLIYRPFSIAPTPFVRITMDFTKR